MTGFGRGEHTDSQVCYQVEISSVNRKQADVSISIPRNIAALEAKIRKRVLAQVSRGRVNVTISLLPLSTGRNTPALRIDHALAERYLTGLRELISDQADIGLNISAADLLRAPGIFELEERCIPPDTAWSGIRPALDHAMDELIAARETEGAHLRADLEKRIARLEKETTIGISDLAPAMTEQHRRQLSERLANAGLPLPLDDERLLREVALFADKSDITEELTRLASHLEKFSQLMADTKPAGRSLDFFSQELSREFNTIASKASSAAITQLVVQGKTEVEKIREQVQNIE